MTPTELADALEKIAAEIDNLLMDINSNHDIQKQASVNFMNTEKSLPTFGALSNISSNLYSSAEDMFINFAIK